MMLCVLHTGIASATKTPEMMIDEQEGKLLATSVVNVLDQFDIKPDPKAQAIFGLVVAAGTVYGPRVAAIGIRKQKAAREQQAAPMPGMVVN